MRNSGFSWERGYLKGAPQRAIAHSRYQCHPDRFIRNWIGRAIEYRDKCCLANSALLFQSRIVDVKFVDQYHFIATARVIRICKLSTLLKDIVNPKYQKAILLQKWWNGNHHKCKTIINDRSFRLWKPSNNEILHQVYWSRTKQKWRFQ